MSNEDNVRLLAKNTPRELNSPMTSNVDPKMSIRTEILTEYYKLTDIIHKYDDYFLRIKAWGVTVSGAAAAYATTQGSGATFLIAAVLSIAFWLTESRYKILQLDHFLRVRELEEGLSENSATTVTPRIFGALNDQKALHREQKRWQSVLFWPHVMFPHVFFTVIGILGGIALLIMQAITQDNAS